MCINKEEKEEEFGSTRPAGFDTGKNELTFREMAPTSTGSQL